jgi:hypothetical protein
LDCIYNLSRGVENNKTDVPEEAAAGVSDATGTSRERLEKSITSSIVKTKNKFVGM